MIFIHEKDEGVFLKPLHLLKKVLMNGRKLLDEFGGASREAWTKKE